MFSLRCKRLSGDMIEVFKMIHDSDTVNLEKLFCIDEDERTRIHSFIKIRRHVNSSIGMKFFTRRIINYIYWNHLTDVVVSCRSLSTFKIKLNEFMTSKGEI